MKRVAAGAYAPNPRIFEPAKRLDDRANYFMSCGKVGGVRYEARSCGRLYLESLAFRACETPRR